ncbi:MAG: hypothetical protein AABY27_04385, partial [Pseudomonadota bacterium]
MPAIILIIGVIIVYGKNGWINKNLEAFFDFSLGYSIYGIAGVLLGHLAFCVPIMVRVILNCLDSISEETWRLTSQLNFSNRDIFRIIEWPHIRLATMSLSILVFMMCFTSFTIVLALGGGPNVTSIEVAIYHALKLDFNLSLASNLALIQVAVCFVLMFVLDMSNIPLLTGVTRKIKRFYRPNLNNKLLLILDIIFIGILFIIVLMPVLAVIINGFNSKFLYMIQSEELWNSIRQSFYISIFSSLLNLFITLSLVSGAFYFNYFANKPKWVGYIRLLSNAKLIFPSFVLSAGLFIALNHIIPIKSISFYLIIIMNTIVALPFAMNIILSPSLSFSKQEIYLAQSLNIKGWNFIRLIYWPKLRKSISYAFALVMAIAWGDINVTALFNDGDFMTLSLLLYNLMSDYFIEESYVVALIILVTTLFIFSVIEEFLGGDQEEC